MAKTYAQITQQIEELQREAQRLKQEEVAEVIARIREAIRVYGLTAADLGLGRASTAATPAKASRRSASDAPGDVKFRDAQGNVWGGRGPRPKWLREALAGGAQLEDFAV